MEEDDGHGVWAGGAAEVEDVAVGTQAADDGGPGRGLHRLAMGSDRNLAISADTHGSLLAPDVGLPWTRRNRAKDGAIFGESLLVSRVRGPTQFAMDFMLIGVRHKLVEQFIGSDQLDDAFGGQQGDEPFLLVVMTALMSLLSNRRKASASDKRSPATTLSYKSRRVLCFMDRVIRLRRYGEPTNLPLEFAPRWDAR